MRNLIAFQLHYFLYLLTISSLMSSKSVCIYKYDNKDRNIFASNKLIFANDFKTSFSYQVLVNVYKIDNFSFINIDNEGAYLLNTNNNEL
jgi:hypothetical protein